MLLKNSVQTDVLARVFVFKIRPLMLILLKDSMLPFHLKLFLFKKILFTIFFQERIWSLNGSYFLNKCLSQRSCSMIILPNLLLATTMSLSLTCWICLVRNGGDFLFALFSLRSGYRDSKFSFSLFPFFHCSVEDWPHKELKLSCFFSFLLCYCFEGFVYFSIDC